MDDFPTWYPMTVKVIATGETMIIKSNRFNPALFERIAEPTVSTSAVAPEPPQTPIISKEALTPPSVEEAPVKALTCEPCNKTFKREQDFKSHNTRFHSA